MANLTDYFEQAIMDYCFRGVDFPAAHSEVYIALHTADPTDSGDENELTAQSYNRISVANPGGWTGSGNFAENDAVIEFGVADENWGTITHASVWDGPTASDNPLWHAELDPSKQIDQQDELRLAAGEVNFQID